MEEKDPQTKLFASLKSIYVTIKRVFTHPVVQTIAILLALAFAVYYFVDQYDSIKNYLSEIVFNTQKLLWALTLTIIATFLGCIRWWAFLSWLGVKSNWIEISKYYAISTLSKYIPGFIWQYASRTLYMEKFKIPIKTVGTAIAAEFLLITTVGGIISSITFLFVPLSFNTQNYLLIAIIILILLILFTVFFPKIISKLYRLLRQEEPKYQPKYYWISILLIFSGWLVMSCVYWLIVNSLDVQNFSLLSAIFFNSTSFTISNLMIPVPNGLVVREAVLVLLGGGFYSDISMVLSSTLFRLLILFAESIIALLFFIISSIIRKKNTASIVH
ncbi:MAG: flippase-like domain-containing protein [Anaerolineaceae bacterium]|nr:flippase-like domain-containing protein [Anaerolineaceae bacterium]